MELILSWLAHRLLGLVGWQAYGVKPPVSKAVIIGAPHTSNWDGFYMILAGFALRTRLQWLVKDSLYKSPLRWLIKPLGAIPIDRGASQNAVEQAVSVFARSDEFYLVLAPEGTRKRAEGWRTGFYYIALGAGVPIYFGFIDYKRKRAGLGGSFTPTGDIDADMETIKAFYESVTPKYPEKFGDIKLLPRKSPLPVQT